MFNGVLTKIAVVLMLVFLSLTCQAGESSDIERNKILELKAENALKDNNIPALSMAVIRNGEISLLKGFGRKYRESNINVNAQSIYQIGSLTKMFTGVIANNLVNEGRLNVEASIINYFPSSIDKQAKVILQDISVKDLLHHRSGIPGWALNNGRVDGNPMLGGYSTKDMLVDLKTIELKFKPGNGLAYSNSGYALLGYVLEVASGLNYSELLKKYITDEYGLNSTEVELSGRQKERLVTPYRKDDRLIKTQPWEMGMLLPAGGVFSSIDDLSNLMRIQISAYFTYLNAGKYNALVTTETLAPFYGKDTYYGFGLVKGVKSSGAEYFHGGDLDGFASEYRFSPKLGIGLILLTSSGGKWIKDLEKDLYATLEMQTINPK